MPVDSVRADLGELRQAALSGEPTIEIRDRVQAQLRKWIARTDRPTGTRGTSTVDTIPGPFHVQAEDFAGFVSLRQVADAVRAPLTVEYWKSAPYFFNFLNGYRVGEHLLAGMKVPDRRAQLMPLFRGAQRITKSDVGQFQPLDWANARMRALAAETLDQGWWRLLWMPPSLPYHSLGGPYESVDSTAITKHLIFSSWVAAPSAIASLLSYEVQRRIFAGERNFANTPSARAAILESPRLSNDGWEACLNVGARLVLATAGTCLAHGPAGCRPRPPGFADRGSSARMGAKPRRGPHWSGRQHQLYLERGLVLVRACGR